MRKLDHSIFLKNYENLKEFSLHGRYITLSHIEPLLKAFPKKIKLEILGYSHQNRPIYTVRIGSGSKKVMIWSQMHGNESTGTKAIFDLLNFWLQDDQEEESILKNCSLILIPMLNPDGAEVYTRENAQKIDLNRDVLDQQAPESKLLLQLLKAENPQYCFNLHDQRTIFSVGDENQPATLSFLAPSIDIKRTVTEGRKATMAVIGEIYQTLKDYLPNQIGRYSDEFYPTATGDNFEKMGYHTILIEAGHYLNDYSREMVRKFNALALWLGLNSIAEDTSIKTWESYLNIPENEKNYLDVIYKNVFLKTLDRSTAIGVLFKEVLNQDKIRLAPTIEQVGNLSNINANKIIDLFDKEFDNDADFLKKIEKNQESV